MVRSASIALFALLLAPALAHAEGSELTKLADRTKTAIVALDHRPGAMLGPNPIDGGARTCGFLIEGGYIVTSAAPLRGRQRMDVRLYGGLRTRADVIGVDPLNNIGLLRLQSPTGIEKRMGALPALAFGPSRGLRPGQSVFTLGNAYDSLILDGTPSFSHGVVTAMTRVREGTYRGVAIETDAAVNPGSFGGPLVDAQGRVVGVVTPTFSHRRWFGQAVPADQVRLAVDALKAGSPPAHGQLGLRLRSTGGEASKQGVEVVEVQAGSGAESAGVKAGDRIKSIDGVAVYDTPDVGRELLRLAPGSPVRVGLQDRTVTVVLGRGRPVDMASRAQPQPEPTGPQLAPKAQAPKLGVRLEERENGRPGLKIVDVDAGGAASKAGMQPGDLLMAVGQTRLRTLDDMRRAMGNLRGTEVRMVVLRGRQLITLRIPLRPETAERPPAETPQAKRPGFLGVFLDPNSSGPGAPVDGAQEGSPAASAGLLPGDVIIGANGRAVRDTQALIDLLGGLSAGDRVVMLVQRGDQRLTKIAVLAPRGAPTPTPAPAPQASGGWLGVALQARAGKLIVVELAPNSPLAETGIRAGDALLSVDGRAMNDLDGLSAYLSTKRPGDRVRIDVERNGWTREFDITLARRP